MREGTGLEFVKDGNGKQGGFKCGTTVSRQQANRAAWRDMTRSGDGRAANTSQLSRKGAVRGKITALEAVYGEYRSSVIEDGLDRHAAGGDFEKERQGRDCASGIGFRSVQ
jgi:hypothetical protein